MSFRPAPWVNAHVATFFNELERSSYPYSDTELDRRRRMVSDPRMTRVYSNAYLTSRLTPQGWRIWFGEACNIGDIAARSVTGAPSSLSIERQRLKDYSSLMVRLGDCMADAAALLNEIDELDISEANIPTAMFDVIKLIEAAAHPPDGCGTDDFELDFDSRIQPKLDAIRRDGKKYMPSVPKIVATLSDEISSAVCLLTEFGTSHSDPVIAAALATRQISALPEYVRVFDESMSCYGADTGGADFLVPDEIMTFQAGAALNIVVDKKSIASARKK